MDQWEFFQYLKFLYIFRRLNWNPIIFYWKESIIHSAFTHVQYHKYFYFAFSNIIFPLNLHVELSCWNSSARPNNRLAEAHSNCMILQYCVVVVVRCVAVTSVCWIHDNEVIRSVRWLWSHSISLLSSPLLHATPHAETFKTV